MAEYEGILTPYRMSNDLNKEEELELLQKREEPDAEVTTEREPSNKVQSIEPNDAIRSNDSQSKCDVSHGIERLSDHIEEKRKRSKTDIEAVAEVILRQRERPSLRYDRIRQHQRRTYMFRPSSKCALPAYEDDYLVTKLANLRFGHHSDDDATTNETPSAQTAVTCLLCDENIAFVLSCSHPFCTSCLNQYVQAQIDLGNSAHIACPMPHAECGEQIQQRELQAILGKKKFAKIDRFALESVTDADPNLRYCPTPDCPYIVYWEDQFEDGAVAPPKFFCPLCDSTSCLKCSISPYHQGVSCNVFQSMSASSRNEQLTRSYIELNKAQMRPCGRCGALVMKHEGGCVKMKCRCGYRFCFVCGVENAICGHTPSHHGFTDNITGRGDFVDLTNVKSPT